MAGTFPIRPLILVAHSDKEARTRMTNLLRQADLDTAAAENGIQALELLRQDLVQLAVVDADLPHSSGVDLVREAAAQGISIPIVICSKSKKVEAAVQAMRMGAYHYFPYPLPPEEFFRVIKDAAHRRPNSLLLPSQNGKQESLGKFAAKIAHDFNNFLTVVHNCALLLQMDANEPSSKPLIDEIRQAAERARKYTEQLFAFAKNKRQAKTVVKLDVVIASLQKIIERLCGSSVQVEVDLDARSEQILAQVPQIEQVLVNLAVNARDSMPDGGNLRIATSTEYVDARPNVRPGDYLVLQVKDSGAGMTPETLARAFEAFFTTKSSEKGNGLGLNIVQEIMSDHGGLIAVESEIGCGTTFTLMFPLYRNSVPAAPKMRSEQWVKAGS